MKILILATVFCILAGVVWYIIIYVINLIEMLYARACVLQTIEQILKMVRYEQIILSDLGIPYRSQINKQNFDSMILPVHRSLIRAYWDLEKRQERVSEAHFLSLHQSYTDNINALNLLLADYNIYNVRYSYAKDKCPIVNRVFNDFKFLDEDIQYRLDNGIEGTGAFTK